ncbi:hypothetical protein [Fructobacillus americanaquae]|uniref:Uncharacterized protein n=1 Tax=Fructobacillus americanaquae TaxID=2940302 RepID=A0ABY5C2T9_9LACO|nr:hypothetical protein [Fructobacillus americanaquae]USS92158.1 hypothetical protein M3M36_00645 [Fructobacillus americanaquae]
MVTKQLSLFKEKEQSVVDRVEQIIREEIINCKKRNINYKKQKKIRQLQKYIDFLNIRLSFIPITSEQHAILKFKINQEVKKLNQLIMKEEKNED